MEANYFTILWWFLPYIHMNQPWVYMCPPSWTSLPPKKDSYLNLSSVICCSLWENLAQMQFLSDVECSGIFFFFNVSRSRIVHSCFIETRILASVFLTFCANQSLIFQLFRSPVEVIMVTGIVEWFLWTRNHVKASYVVAHLIHTTTLWDSCYLLVLFLQKCQTICLKSQSLQVGEPR